MRRAKKFKSRKSAAVAWAVSDLGNVMAQPLARVVAVCDLDSKRLAAGKKMAEDYYSESRRIRRERENVSRLS